uniref:Small ribosomal subunit protein bS16c n=1 Tax=Adiantum capillus-veneris TaxID=13818 RepID=RR16_ADICA|nr:ribosomal protein S16 [Adiantum capillus-veneris]Q85FN9.1 RecName: Full=Small ribosomal subunit protein bS16c; AltName: Full=30S ribosomal protein S16, chloroplastic [Adiantum capillus-veneris]AAP29372.1 ribosomal protein S16 [Adiantum capillus-veneris]
MVKLRPKQCGRKQRTYRIVAIESQSRQEGKVIKEVEFYNPRREETQLDILAITTLCGSGVKLTETVCNIFRRATFKIT